MAEERVKLIAREALAKAGFSKSVISGMESAGSGVWDQYVAIATETLRVCEDLLPDGKLFREEPEGWFLWRAEHQHSIITQVGESHQPLPFLEGPWLVEFQRYPSGGLRAQGRGKTLREAWENGVLMASRIGGTQ